jgi:hypothetical protein
MEAFSRLDLRRDVTAAMIESGGDQDLARVLTRKRRFRREFPQTFEELEPLWLQAGQPKPMPQDDQINREIESAQVLYFVLTESSVLGYSPEVTDSFIDSEVRIPQAEDANDPNPHWPYFVDAWGFPLRFYRWPTRLLRPNGPGNDVTREYAGLLIRDLPPALEDLNRDPDDPTGLIVFWLRNSEDPPAAFASFENNYHTPDTWHSPLVVSAGRTDGRFGLQLPYLALGRFAQPLADDEAVILIRDHISNLNIRVGGQ